MCAMICGYVVGNKDVLKDTQQKGEVSALRHDSAGGRVLHAKNQTPGLIERVGCHAARSRKRVKEGHLQRLTGLLSECPLLFAAFGS